MELTEKQADRRISRDHLVQAVLRLKDSSFKIVKSVEGVWAVN